MFEVECPYCQMGFEDGCKSTLFDIISYHLLTEHTEALVMEKADELLSSNEEEENRG